MPTISTDLAVLSAWIATQQTSSPPEEMVYLSQVVKVSRLRMRTTLSTVPGSIWADMFSGKTALATDTASDSFGWMCLGIDSKRPCSNGIEGIKRAGAESWRVSWYCDERLVCDWGRWPVEYCLSQRAPPRCKLHFERTIGIVVIVLNFGKYTTTILSPALRNMAPKL